jgi:hypothetical protein
MTDTSKAPHRLFLFAALIGVLFFAWSHSVPVVHASVDLSGDSIVGLCHFEGDYTNAASSTLNGTSHNTSFNGSGCASNLTDAVITNGSNGYVSTPSSAVWDIGSGQDFTAGAWVKIGSTATGDQVIMGADDGSGSHVKWVIDMVGGNLTFQGYKDVGTFFDYSVSWSPSLNSCHLVVVRRLGGVWEMYIDGTAQNLNHNDGSSTSPSTGLTLGNAEGCCFFDGQISQAFVAQSALSTTTIQAIYNSGNADELCFVAGCGAAAPSLSSLEQYGPDATTTITDGSFVTTSTVVFGGIPNYSGSSTLQLQVEVTTSTTFSDNFNVTSTFVTPGSSTTATIPKASKGTLHSRRISERSDTPSGTPALQQHRAEFQQRQRSSIG